MTAMHPATGYYQLNQNHMADLRHPARRRALARAARRARPHQPSHHRPLLSALAR